MDWYVQDGGEVEKLTESELRKQLRENDLSGVELARRADESTWRPLHDREIFAEEVPFRGDPADAARWREVKGFGIHAAIFVGVNAFLGFPGLVVLLWGIAMAIHGRSALPALWGLGREGKIPLFPARKAPAALAPHEDEPEYRLALAEANDGDIAHAPTQVPAKAARPSTGTVTDAPGSAAPPPRESTPGDPRRIGRYRIEGRLGAGGMGVVYRGVDEVLDREVAIKLLHPERDVDRGTRRLEREARAVARLNHPNVVTVFDVGEAAGGVFLAMEYIEGETLRAWLELPRSAGDVLRVLIQAAEGLAAAHEAGVVHRDFKPDNVMVGRDGRVRVLDFGLAKPLDTNDSLTRAGALLGTPRYMAPEQLRGEAADTRSDQFSLGVVTLEALYGVHPYAPDGDRSLSQCVLAGERREPPPRADVPAQVREALLRAVSHDRDDRFAAVDEFLASLGPIPATQDDVARRAAAARRMLARRPGEAARRALAAVGELEQAIADLDAKMAHLGAEVDRAAAKSAGGANGGIDRARSALETLRARRAAVAAKLEALHLDLVRGEAEDAAIPDVSEALEDVRFELEAAREVESLLR